MHLSFLTLVLTLKVSTKCCFLAYIPTLPLETSTFIMDYTNYYMLSRKFFGIYDHSSAFQLINFIISLLLHLVSFFSFQDIILIQNIFKIQFHIPLESHYIANLELLRSKQISGYYVAHGGWDSTYYIVAELSANRLVSLN